MDNAGNATFAINDPSSFDPNMKAQSGGAAAFSVDDVQATITELQSKGVTVTVPINESPVCHFACVLDPDGNTVWFHQRKDGSFGNYIWLRISRALSSNRRCHSGATKQSLSSCAPPRFFSCSAVGV